MKQRWARSLLIQAISPILAGLMPATVWGGPQGARLVAGRASVSGNGAAFIVRQSSRLAIINWSDFSIGSSEKVSFVLPSSSSAVLNRVTALSPSQIDGILQSNGTVYLINPNGIMIGTGGRIDAHGFVASTLDVNNAAFMAGGSLLFSGDSTAPVVNQGRISGLGGDVVLIASRVRNDGQITTANGSAILAGGTQVLLQQAGTPGISVRVSGNGTVGNNGIIDATRAELAANGGNTYALAINNTGIIRATGVQNANGHIYLTAGGDGNIENSGTLDASSANGHGGDIVVTGHHIQIDGTSDLTANGATGGGDLLVGGSWQGENPAIVEAIGTIVQPGALLEASATQKGNGGTVVVRSDVNNSDSVTRAYGTLLATGGPGGGDGGRIETSGHWLDTSGAAISASAANGRAGEWLLDPFDLTISGSSTNNFNTAGNPWVPTASGGNVAASDIDSALNGGNSVTISTGSSGSDLGNIVESAAITKSLGATAVTLTLNADNNITINQPISSTSGALNIVLDAHHGANGAIILDADLTTNGGNISFGTDRTSGGSLIGGDVFINGSSAQTLTTSGGTVTVFGQMLIANPGGLTINTGGGAVDFQGTVDSGDSYTFVNSSKSWDAAEVAAVGSTGGGAATGDTYLATITSSLENTIASAAANYQASWLGGERVLGIGTNQVWRLVTGPEGTQNGGQGEEFFLENFTGNGGSAISGAFTNWNGGEPNNSGGANTDSGSETALEFVGTSGKWNDLSHTSSEPYLVETNLVASPLTVNAGAATVTFAGLVGGNKALASLTVTGPVAMNGGGVTSTGSQTYNNTVTLGSHLTTLAVTGGDLSVGSNITYAGSSPANLTLKASGSVTLGSNVAINATGAGSLQVILDSDDADTNGSGAGAIVLNPGSSIASNGGEIFLGGGIDPTSDAAIGTISNTTGIYLDSATINAAGGDITINAQGYSGGGVGLAIRDQPVNNIGTTIETNGGGAISISATGIGGSDGFFMQEPNHLIQTQDGDLTITASSSGSAIDWNRQGAGAGPGPTVESTGLGNVNLIATSGDISINASNVFATDGLSGGVTLQSAGNIVLNGGLITTQNSAVVLDADSEANQQGNIQVINSTISTHGGTITLGGGATPDTVPAYGINGGGTIADSSGVFLNQATLDSGGGDISIRGTGSASSTPDDAVGVMIEYQSAIDSGAGTVAITGIGPTSGATGNMGVNIRYQNSLGAGGTLGVTGSSVTSANTSSGAIVITGTGSTSGAHNSAGFTLQDGSSVTATGSGGGITINGTGGTFADNTSPGNRGISLDGGTNISASAGNVTLNGSSPGGVFPIFTYDVGARTISAGASGGILTINPSNDGVNFDTATLSAAKLLLTGTGTFVLTNTSNTIGTLAGSITGGDLFVTNDGSLTIGSIGGTNGLSDSGGAVTVQAAGATADLTLSKNVAGTGTGSTVVLAAGRNFLNTGSATINPGAGRFLVYSTSPLSSSLGGLTGGELYNTTYDGNPPSSISATGNQFLYSLAPTLTFTAADKTKVYGQANPSFTYSVGGLVGTDTIGQAASGTPSLSSAATSSSGVANYAIDIAGGTLSSLIGYSLSFAPGNLSVTTAPLTITAVDKSKVYGAALPTFTASYTGLVNGDLASAISGLSLSTSATAASGVGAYGIDVSGATSGNYNITEDPGTLTISKAPLTITADDKSKVYGAAMPTLTASYSGLVNGDGAGAISGLSLSTSAGAASSVGAYGITASGAASPNYNITLDPGTLTISPAPLTITADDQTKVYAAALPTLTASYTGLVNGDGTSAISGLSLSTPAGAGSDVGAYGITPVGATSNNYDITEVPGTLTITQAPLTITAVDKSKVYGAPLPTFTANYSGFVNGDGIGAISNLSLTTLASAASNVGAFDITPSGASAGNYNITEVPGTLTITPASLTITAADKSKVYGAPLPTFTAIFGGLVNGDGASAISGLNYSTSAGAGSNIGSYGITPSGASSGNYTISLFPGTLTVTKAPLMIVADDKLRNADISNPKLTATFEGLVNGDQKSDIAGVSLMTAANINSPVGDYPIIVSGGANSNYDISLTDGTLFIRNDFVLGLRELWQSSAAIAPNFATESLLQPAVLATAEPNGPDTVDQPMDALTDANITYRDSMPTGKLTEAEISARSRRILLNAFAHASSFDRIPRSDPSGAAR